MPKRTPSEAAAKWNTNLVGSTAEIELGVNKVTVAPSEQAIAQKDKMVDNWLASIENGKWEDGLRRVDLAEWKRSMIDIGIKRIRDGAMKAQPKLQRYYEKAFPLMQNLEDTIAAMPSRDLQDSEARMLAWMRGMVAISASLQLSQQTTKDKIIERYYHG